MTVGFVTLAEIAGRLQILSVGCNRYGRHGRLHVDRLLATHGATLACARAATHRSGRLPQNDRGRDARSVQSAFSGFGRMRTEKNDDKPRTIARQLSDVLL